MSRNEKGATLAPSGPILQSVRIRNFRGFRDFAIKNLGHINIIAGRNNSGKTSILEALFLLSGSSNPALAINANVVRLPIPELPQAVLKALWRPLFHDLDMQETIDISAVHISKESLKLTIKHGHAGTIDLPFKSPEANQKEPIPETVPRQLSIVISDQLLFKFSLNTKTWAESYLRVVGDGFQINRSERQEPLFPATILSTLVGNLREDAHRLGMLRQKKKSDRVVLDSLKVLEPRLRSIEDNSSSGAPMIWGDIGLDELVPLAVMGSGVQHVARLALAISSTPNGLVLVDEIESGLHHSVLGKVWKSLGKLAREFNVQVVATTHSYECLSAAQKVLDLVECVRFHRLDITESGEPSCVTYEPDEIAAAIKHDFEVR